MRAPAARHVQVPSPSELVSSMSIRRDMERNGIAYDVRRTIELRVLLACTVAVVPIYALGSDEPSIASDAYIHPDAVIIGSVTIGSESTVWPGAVLRGDGGEIFIGAQTSIQDNSVIHTTAEVPTVVGDRCVIGHIVHLEACTIKDDVLVGNAAMVLHNSVINSWAIVAANSVVLYGVDVPSGAIAVGSPAVIKEGRADREMITLGVQSYVERGRQFRTDLRRLD